MCCNERVLLKDRKIMGIIEIYPKKCPNISNIFTSPIILQTGADPGPGVGVWGHFFGATFTKALYLRKKVL